MAACVAEEVAADAARRHGLPGSRAHALAEGLNAAVADACREGAKAAVREVLMELISNDAERKALGQRAAETLRSQSGTSQKTVAALERLLAPANAAAASPTAGSWWESDASLTGTVVAPALSKPAAGGSAA